MSAAEQILEGFSGIGLEEAGEVKLMDRWDTKFIFHREQLTDILNALKQDYKILEIAGKRTSHYQTTYFDTGGHALYLMHHNGKATRYKVRERTYLDSGERFLEVKRHTNKGKTVKKRIPLLNGTDRTDFLNRSLNFDPQTLQPSLTSRFTRYTLVAHSKTERLTIDTHLQFQGNGTSKELEDLVIAEVKYDHKTQSPFVALMKERKIRDLSLSKYCVGIAYTVPTIKANNFKELLNLINEEII